MCVRAQFSLGEFLDFMSQLKLPQQFLQAPGVCGKWGWRRVLFWDSPTQWHFLSLLPCVIFQELAEEAVLPICSGTLQPCSIATWFAWELLWCDLKEQKQKKHQGFGSFVKSLQVLSFCIIFISPLSGLEEWSLPTLPLTWVFSCVLGNWSCLIVTTDLIRARLSVHSCAEYLWGLFA